MDWPTAAIIISIFITGAASFTSIFINKKKNGRIVPGQDFRETMLTGMAEMKTDQKNLFIGFRRLEKRFDDYIQGK